MTYMTVVYEIYMLLFYFAIFSSLKFLFGKVLAYYGHLPRRGVEVDHDKLESNGLGEGS